MVWLIISPYSLHVLENHLLVGYLFIFVYSEADPGFMDTQRDWFKFADKLIQRFAMTL